MSRATFYWRKRYGDLPQRVLNPPKSESWAGRKVRELYDI
jgi:hypothetical protein